MLDCKINNYLYCYNKNENLLEENITITYLQNLLS